MRDVRRECVICGESKLLRFFPLAEPENPCSEHRIKECFKCAPEAHKYAKKYDHIDCPVTNQGKALRAQVLAEREALRTPAGIQSKEASKRRAQRVKQATPCWANKGAILNIYKKAKKTSQETGVLQHVDHIIPIYSEHVCGLHVENNLRIVPARQNLKKNNKFTPGPVDIAPSNVALI